MSENVFLIWYTLYREIPRYNENFLEAMAYLVSFSAAFPETTLFGKSLLLKNTAGVLREGHQRVLGFLKV